MRVPNWLRRLAALALTLSAILAGYHVLVRPWFLGWGASAADRTRALPGDSIVAGVRTGDMSTRAITIDAPAHEVWPWVAQLGQDRGGFYSFEILEDLAGARIDNTDRIHPEHQDWQPGDKLWMYPPGKLNGQGHALFMLLEPGHALAFATRRPTAAAPYDGSWAFVVEPLDAHRSRLLVRGRAAGELTLAGKAFDRFVFAPMHFVMERRMMLGIKQRAEHTPVSTANDVAQVMLWTVTFGLFVTAAVWVMRKKRWVGALAALVCAAGVFQLLTFAQPSALLGGFVLLELLVVFWLAVTPRPLPAE